MAAILRDERVQTDPVAAAADELAATGVALMPCVTLTRSLGVHRETWVPFGRHWDHLVLD
ncbi:MAG: hypothetical protein QOF15_1837, partial [Mycobacterium sp.]|nr:hypothetical protein [Mycobacterium sp.]